MKKAQKFEVHIPRWEELPELDLYLDQVVTFIDKYFSNYLDSKDDNNQSKIITKTMINNYVKQKVLEPPIKKKYNRNNLAYLIIICILKQVYSINDINKLIKIGIRNTPIDIAYNRFCDFLESSIDYTFNGTKTLEDFKNSQLEYLLFNVCQTFASKLYVEKKFLGKFK